MSPLQRRITIASAICGGLLTLLVVILEAMNALQPLEWWLYDLRARTCQFSTPPPSDKIVHLDIDDASIRTIGRWPWPRATMARLLDEIAAARPLAVGIDVLYTEPQLDSSERLADGTDVLRVQDPALAQAMRRLGNVVLPGSLRFAQSQEQHSPLRVKAVEALARDLSQSDEQLARQLSEFFPNQKDLAARIALDMADIRGEAVRQRVRQAVEDGAANLDQLVTRLLPQKAATAQAGVALHSPVASVIAEEYDHLLSELALSRFAIDMPTSLRTPPPDGEMYEVPLPIFSQAIAACGFADYNLFPEPVVRIVPLFVRSGSKLYPQFAFAMACRMLGVPISQVQITDTHVTIPAPDGAVIIPVRARYSRTMGRELGSIMDIPWFGTDNWATMYDWPEHRAIKQHYSMNKPYEIIEVIEKMQANNRQLDKALPILMEVLDTRASAEYAAKPLPIEDFEARRKVAEHVLAELKESGYEELARRADAELSSNERYIRDGMVSTGLALRQNRELVDELARKRAALAQLLAGKGVLIGSVATASGDVVTSSLHARCPGVVVHGVLINSILTRNFLVTAPGWVNLIITLLLGAAATAVTSWLPPARAVLLAILLALAYFTVNGALLFDRSRLIVDAAAPLIVIAVCWGGCVVVRLVIEGIERIRIQRERAVIEHEIALARQVQAALIPKQLNILTNIESHGWTLAATTTGGDCFDLWKLADGRLGILVADASGHGLGPSIIVSEVRALVRALCDIAPEPQKLLERVNYRLASDLQGSKFCTAFVGFLSEDGQMSWGSAGHGPMLWSPTPGGEPRELEGTGLPLGVSEDWFGDESVPVLALEEKGWLIAISDGIFEAPDPKGEQFGTDRVKQILKQYANESCETIVSKLRDAVHKWQVVAEPADDQTIVLVRRSTGYNGNAGAPARGG